MPPILSMEIAEHHGEVDVKAAPSALHLPFHADLVLVFNAIEGFFAKLSKRRLKRGVFHSVVDLQAPINSSQGSPHVCVRSARKQLSLADRWRALMIFHSVEVPGNEIRSSSTCASLVLSPARMFGDGEESQLVPIRQASKMV